MADDARPLDLDSLERHGATRFGRGVSRVVIVHDDGRQVSIDLPQPFRRPLSEDERREQAVIAFMAKVEGGTRIKGQTIAAELEEDYSTLRKVLTDMTSREILFSQQGQAGYAKGPNFPANV